MKGCSGGSKTKKARLRLVSEWSGPVHTHFQTGSTEGMMSNGLDKHASLAANAWLRGLTKIILRGVMEKMDSRPIGVSPAIYHMFSFLR